MVGKAKVYPINICWCGSTVEQLTCNQQVVGSIPITSSNVEDFPSGQRGQTVNLLSLTSVVRIHPLPPKSPCILRGDFISSRMQPRKAAAPFFIIFKTPSGAFFVFFEAVSGNNKSSALTQRFDFRHMIKMSLFNRLGEKCTLSARL